MRLFGRPLTIKHPGLMQADISLPTLINIVSPASTARRTTHSPDRTKPTVSAPVVGVRFVSYTDDDEHGFGFGIAESQTDASGIASPSLRSPVVSTVTTAVSPPRDTQTISAPVPTHVPTHLATTAPSPMSSTAELSPRERAVRQCFILYFVEKYEFTPLAELQAIPFAQLLASLRDNVRARVRTCKRTCKSLCVTSYALWCLRENARALLTTSQRLVYVGRAAVQSILRQ